MKRLSGFGWIAAAALAACGVASTGGDAAQGGATGLAVTGSLRNTYLRDDGTAERSVPADIAQWAISAVVPEGAGFRETAGAFASDGSFIVPDSGTGDYLLRIVAPGTTPRYLSGAARTVDLGADYPGSPNRTFAALSTPVTFAVTGLAPWATGSTLSLFTTDTRLALPLQTTTAAANPAVGATSAALPVEFKGRPLPAAGSPAWVYQLEQRTLGTTPYTVATRLTDLTGALSLADGSAATVPVALTAPTLLPVGLDLRRSEFVAGLADVAPAATVTANGFTLSVRALPRSAATHFTSSHYVPLFTASMTGEATDLDFGPVGYAGGLPSWFSVVRYTSLTMQVQFPAALGQPAASVYSSASRIEPAAGAPAAIAPQLGPARLPRIAGRDALQPQSGVGLTPALSWSAPQLGAPTHYIVQLYEVAAGSLTGRGSVYVRGTSATVPPLLLQPGRVYVANVLSAVEPSFDFAAPQRYTVPRELVPAFTAPFTP